MSISFNGTTSRLEHTTASGFNTATYTILAWLYATTRGEGNQGIIHVVPEIGNGTSQGGHWFSCDIGSANSLRLRVAFGVSGATSGEWTFPATEAQWNAVAVTMDSGSASNNPAARVNFNSVTVTEVTTPSGSRFAPASTGYCVGNRNQQDATFDGRIGFLSFHNVILTNGEMDQALRRPGSVGRGRVLYLPMYHATYIADLSGSALNGTATSLSTGDGPPCSPVFVGSRQRYSTTAASPPAPIFRTHHANFRFGQYG